MDVDGPQPPVSNWGNSSLLAKDSIEKNVAAHQQYLSARGDLTDFPTLVELAAERLAQSTLEGSDSLDDIPPVILSANIWGWRKIAYPAICRAVLRLSSDPDFVNELAMEGSIKNIDEWIIMNEKWLRDGDQAQWQHGLVTLSDADSVFPNSVHDSNGRTIIRPEALPGYEVLCEARKPRVTIQPSVEAFKKAFDEVSDGLLRNLDWSNLMVAGGMVLGTLMSVDAADGQPRPDPRWNSSDIDIYVYGLTPGEANQKIKHLFDTFRANLPAGTPTLVVRNCTTITFYARYPLRRIQIVLKLSESPRSVLLNFDLDVCAMGWDGTTLWMLPRAARALETGSSVFTMNLVHGHYLSDRRASTLVRIMKYADKGYGIRILPSYISSLVARQRHQAATPSLNLHDTPQDRLDFLSIATQARQWTTKVANEDGFNYLMWRTGQARLSGFTFFMRSVAFWEMGRRGEVIITADNWASNSYRDDESMYDDAQNPGYKWDERFDITAFQRQNESSNEQEITTWAETDLHERLFSHGVDMDPGEYYGGIEFQRITCAPTLDGVLRKKKDMLLQVLLPCEFAVYANDLVSRAQAHAGLRETKLLAPAVRRLNLFGASDPQADGLFLWRIGKDLMWQQLDRRIDEVFEVLYAFRRVNKHLRADPAFQAPRFSKELERRRGYDEFDAFAEWLRS